MRRMVEGHSDGPLRLAALATSPASAREEPDGYLSSQTSSMRQPL
jgi:hypothetical protein